MKNSLKKITRSKIVLAAASAFSTFTANTALAVDDAAVAAAQTAGQTSVEAAAVGLIAIVAVIVGITMVINLLKKA